MTSPFFSIASADSDTDKDARGKSARWECGGESACEEGEEGKVAKVRERERERGKDEDEEGNILLRFQPEFLAPLSRF